MVVNHQYTRTDTLELRDLICRKIGSQRGEKYFDLLRRLFSLRISKIEFHKLCVRTIGHENLALHNRLIKALIKNACLAKTPPPKVRQVGQGVKVANGYSRRSLHTLNSGAFPQQPRKRQPLPDRDHKYLEQRNRLAQLGKSSSNTGEEVVQRVLEQQSATELHSFGSRPPIEGASVEDGEEVEQFAGSPSVQSRSPVTAPLGIFTNIIGAQKVIRSGFGSACIINRETCQNSGVLPDTRSLRSLLEKKLELEGIGISLDCVNLLNNGLDVYLKRLIEPCVAIARAHSGTGLSRHLNCESIWGHSNGQVNPGLNGIVQGRIAQNPQRVVCASMLDFHVSVESNARILGEDWSVQLEKICARAMEQ